MSAKRIVSLAVAPVLVAAGALSATTFSPHVGRAAVQTGPPPLELPKQWVPFTGTLRISTHETVSNGMMYRDSHGSTSTVMESLQLGTMITINNVSQRLSFYYVQNRGWSSQPIALDHERSPKPRFNVTEVVKLADKYEGSFEVCEHCGQGRCSWHLPELNWLAVRMETNNVVGLELTHIVVGEPSAARFVPPSGAVVKKLDTSGGIMRKQ